MPAHRVEVATYRPASYDPTVAIGERQTLSVDGWPTQEQAEAYELSVLEPVRIGNKIYHPSIVVPPWRDRRTAT